MKRIALMVVAAMITSLSFSQKLQEKDVPAPVKTTFIKQYSNTKEVKWEKEGDNFEAEFKLDKTEQSVLFDAQGNILETEVEIELNQLPNGILDYVKTNYKGQSVKEAAKITDGKDTVTYEVEIKGMDLIFDSKGGFIKENK
ncbi:MAG: PepSY-like domain-containing protein [Bacteroidetes bacterium]|nr:PepSY-like domain-containing protein [Bacteroidota bacterium]